MQEGEPILANTQRRHYGTTPVAAPEGLDTSCQAEWFLLGRVKLPLRQATGRYGWRDTRSRWPVFIPFVSLVDCCILAAAIVRNGGFERFSDNIWLGPSLDVIIQFGGELGCSIIK